MLVIGSNGSASLPGTAGFIAALLRLHPRFHVEVLAKNLLNADLVNEAFTL
jgi:hypothetical protein